MHPTPDQLAAVMIERARRDLETRAHEAARVHDTVVGVLRPALSTGEVTRAWIIGSLALGYFGEGSDVDVVVEGLDRAREGLLRDALEDATRLQVDLLRLEELDAGFREAVLRDGELIS